MRLFGSRSRSSAQSPAQLEAQLAHLDEQNQFLLHTIRSLLFLLKEFSFDLTEIDAAGYTHRLEEMAKAFTADGSAARQRQAFDGNKQAILGFAASAKTYFTEKEQELKKIIVMLTDAITEMQGENQAFNSHLRERNRRLDEITHLNDIRKVKEQLKVEVDQMKKALQEKQSRDNGALELLSRQVDLLKLDLEKATDASQLDALTGAFNRLAFDTQIKRIVERHIVTGSPLSLLMCDIDNFKSVNDTYGHRVGDRILKCFVQECRSLFRSTDYLIRYGGDEFMIVMPNTPLRHALHRARTLCKTLAAKKYLLDVATPNETIVFTASIGVSQVRKNDTLEALITRADQALYASKHGGKNLAVSEREVHEETASASAS